MPLILAPTDYTRWLSDEPDPGDLMRPFPADPMRMWPISTRVNKPGRTTTLDCRTDRDSYFGGVIVSPLRFRCGARRYAHLTHLDCAVGVPSCGVVTAKVSGHAVTLRSSPTVLADTSMSVSTSTRILSGKLPRRQLKRGNRLEFRYVGNSRRAGSPFQALRSRNCNASWRLPNGRPCAGFALVTPNICKGLVGGR